MSERIHGHEVMRMMIEDGGVHTKSTLREAIANRFGEGAKFYTCSEDDMTADELIVFLQGHGKFVAEDGGFTTEPDMICDH